MDDETAAEEAVRNINGTSVKGRNIKVEKSESKGPIYLYSILGNFKKVAKK